MNIMQALFEVRSFPPAMTLCDLKKGDITRKPAKVLSLIDNPAYVCAKCLRQANDKKNLCSAMPLAKLAKKAKAS